MKKEEWIGLGYGIIAAILLTVIFYFGSVFFVTAVA